MAFMNFYNLIRYETDPKLLNMYQLGIYNHWQYERLERDPFAEFVYAACCYGKSRTDQWGTIDLTPPASSFENSIDTLKRYPFDLIDWPMSNAQRIDMRRVPDENGRLSSLGGRLDGTVFPIDERMATRWDRELWALTSKGNGTRLRTGVPFMLAYYMGRVHGFIGD